MCPVVKYQNPHLFKGILKKTSRTVRNQIADELNAFLELHKINYTNLKESLLNNKKKKLCMSSCSILEGKYFNGSIIKIC